MAAPIRSQSSSMPLDSRPPARSPPPSIHCNLPMSATSRHDLLRERHRRNRAVSKKTLGRKDDPIRSLVEEIVGHKPARHLTESIETLIDLERLAGYPVLRVRAEDAAT